MRGFYAQLSDDNFRVLCSIDIKRKIQDRLKDKTGSCKPSDKCTSNTTECVFSTYESILPYAIIGKASGEGISNCLQLKNIVYSIPNDIQSNPKKTWPPNPQDIINSENACHMILHNFIAISNLISSNSCMDGDGVIKLSKRKSTKVKETCQNVGALVPNFQPRLSQALLSLNVYSETG